MSKRIEHQVVVTVESMVQGARSGRPAELVVSDNADVIAAIRAEAASQMGDVLVLFSGAHNGLDFDDEDGLSEEALSNLCELADALVDAVRALQEIAPWMDAEGAS